MSPIIKVSADDEGFVGYLEVPYIAPHHSELNHARAFDQVKVNRHNVNFFFEWALDDSVEESSVFIAISGDV